MHPHLHAAVDTQVKLRILVYSTCIAGLKSGEFELKRLLIELGGLRLSRVLDTVHSRRKHVVDRCACGIFLYIHHRHVEFALSRRVVAAVEVELIVAPFAAHEFECGEAKMGDCLESGHEDSGKAD